ATDVDRDRTRAATAGEKVDLGLRQALRLLQVRAQLAHRLPPADAELIPVVVPGNHQRVRAGKIDRLELILDATLGLVPALVHVEQRLIENLLDRCSLDG